MSGNVVTETRIRSFRTALALIALACVLCLPGAPALAETTVSTPRSVAGSTMLSGAACASATSCVAVGNKSASPFSPDLMGVVVPVNDGVPSAATPISGSYRLLGVACASAASCLAVGYNGDFEGVVVPITNGVPGAATTVAGPSALTAVACPSAASCLAVGATDLESGGKGLMVPVTNGVAGAVTRVAGTRFLFGVACPSAVSCVAVGGNASSGVTLPVTNGVPGAVAAVAESYKLHGVACSSAASCIVVGEGAFGEGRVAPVTNGVPGAAATVAGGAGNDALGDVACVSPARCLAVKPSDVGIVTITNGIARDVSTSPLDRSFSTFYELHGVACPSATRCLAAGTQNLFPDPDVGMVVPITITPAPDVWDYRLTNSTFAAAGRSTPGSGSAARTNKHRKGTTFRYTLSEAATVKILIAQRRSGRRKGERCVVPRRRLRHARKCTRIVVKGMLTRVSRLGANRVAFSGRIGSKALRPGSYQATLTATDATKNTSTAQTILFEIAKH